MNKQLQNGFHPVNRIDLQKLLKKLGGAASRVWLAYIAYPAQELNPDPDSEYMSALSVLTNQDIIDATGLCENSVTKARNELCTLGELEKISRGVYKIIYYKKLKYVRETSRNIEDTVEISGEAAEISGETSNNEVWSTGEKSKTGKSPVSNRKKSGYGNGDEANGGQRLGMISPLDRKEEEDLDLLDLGGLIGQIENDFSSDPAKIEQYKRWLKSGIREGVLDIAILIDNSRPGRVIKWGDPDASDMLRDLTERLSDGSINIRKILDGIWSAKEENVSTSGWFKWLYNHVDQWDHFHKDDPGVIDGKTRGSEERRDRAIEIRDLLMGDYLATDKNRRTLQSLLDLSIEQARSFIGQGRGEELKDDDLMRRLDELIKGAK